MEEHYMFDQIHHQHDIIYPFENTQWPYNNIHPLYQSPQLLPPQPAPSRLNPAENEEEEQELGAMKEMVFKIAAMQPIVDIDPATIRKRKRRNERISEDRQSVMARNRRERISEKIRILQRLVPGGTKMDIGSMLEEAVRYVKFLKRQIHLLQGLNYQQTPW